jgi:hypothetical protein
MVDDVGVRAGFGWAHVGMHPTVGRSLARLEAEERRAAREEAEQLAARVDARYNAAVLVAQRDAAMRGEAWSPMRPFASWPPVAQLVAEHDAIEAAEDRRREVQQLVELGLLHLVDGPPNASRSSAAGAQGPPPGVRSRSASSLVQRIRDFFAFTEHGDGCVCQGCVRFRVNRKGASS